MERTPQLAIIFDLDGTLIDSAPEIRGIANKVLEAEGRAPLSLVETRSFVGNGAGVFVAKMMAAREMDTDPAIHERLLKTFIALYDGAVSLTRLYPHVVEMLEDLRRRDICLGVCTNKPEAPARFVLDHFDLAQMFDVVIGGDSLPVRKPDPAPLKLAMKRLGCDAVVFVGDSEIDAETAVRAKVQFALFTKGYRKAAVADMPHDLAFGDYAGVGEKLVLLGQG